MSGFKRSAHEAKKDTFWEGKWKGLDLRKRRAGKEVVRGDDCQRGWEVSTPQGQNAEAGGKRKGKKTILKYSLSPAQGKNILNPKTAEEVKDS